jgi:hypothetical protein
MESLALAVTFILLVIYGSGVIAFGLSWARPRPLLITSGIFSAIALITGLWLAVTLIDGNGLLAGGIPALLGIASMVNVFRRWKLRS